MVHKRKVNCGYKCTVIINGKEFNNLGGYLSYFYICDLIEIDCNSNPSIVYSHKQDSGSLIRDEELEVVDGLIITAVVTGNT